MSRINYYQERLVRAEQVLKRQNKSSKWLFGVKLISFLFFLYLLYLMATQGGAFYLIATVVIALLYGFSYWYDWKLQQNKILLMNLIETLQHELAYLAGDFKAFDKGSDFVDPSHAYSYDLDLFGENSFFHRINRTHTPFGRKTLVHWLMNLPQTKDAFAKIKKRQESVTELKEKSDWRVDFQSLRIADSNRMEKLFLLFNEKDESVASKLKVVGIISSVTLFALSVVLAYLGKISSTLPVFIFFVQFMLSTLVSRKVMKMTKEVGLAHKELGDYLAMVKHIQSIKTTSRLNRSLWNKLLKGENNMLRAFKSLSRLSDNIDQRGNILMLVLLNGTIYSDVILLSQFKKWKRRYASHLEEWMQTIGEIDALCTMATYAFNTPQANFATLVDGDAFVYEAKGVYHPFLKEGECVANDFSMEKADFHIITGANMAGKSTFLRTLGINYVMAMTGFPVCATCYKVSCFNLFTSMRTADDLSANISYFNAELRRLKALLHSCQKYPYTFVILDEILKGTNSRDKLTGSRLFLRKLAEMNVSGVVATHDLLLSEMAVQENKRFKNYCFEIEIGENIKYDYKIKPGVAVNMNATYLLKQLLK